MWGVKVFNTNQSGSKNINIRYLEEKDGTHFVVLKDLMVVLGYAKSSIISGLNSLMKNIPQQFKKTECTDSLTPGNRLTPLLVLDYSGCSWFLNKAKTGNPAYLKQWLESNIFTDEEISNLTVIKDIEKPDYRKRENHNIATTQWTFNDQIIRIMMLNEKLYFYAVDISRIFGDINHRHILSKYIDPEYSSTIYHGQRPATLLTIEGVIQLLNHVKDKDTAMVLKNWLVQTAIPQFKEKNTVEAFTSADMKSATQKQTKKTNITSLIPTKIEFEECPTALKEIQYPFASEGKDEDETKLRIVTEGDKVYFTIKSLSDLLDISVQELTKLIPAIWHKYTIITQVTTYTDKEGNQRTQHSKQGFNCIEDSGLCFLLEHINNEPFQKWILTTVFPALMEEGYVPSAPYDIDTEGLTEKDMKNTIDIYDKPRNISVQDLTAQRFNCTFNDEDISIIVRQNRVWFALATLEKALEYPSYLTRSNPLKAIDFNVVPVASIQRIDFTSNRSGQKWVPYAIDYEGLKAFLASCKKPNAEAFYMYLEETIIPYIRNTLSMSQANPSTAETSIPAEDNTINDKEDEAVMKTTNKEESKTTQQEQNQTPVEETGKDIIKEPTTPVEEKDSSTNINVEQLLSDPDTFIRMLKAYKAVKDSKDDLSAENEALREYIRANKSKIDFADTLSGDVDSEATKTFIKQLAENIVESGSQRLKEWLKGSLQNPQAVNYTFSCCADCGTISHSADTSVCPKCGSTHIDKFTRVGGADV